MKIKSIFPALRNIYTKYKARPRKEEEQAINMFWEFDKNRNSEVSVRNKNAPRKNNNSASRAQPRPRSGEAGVSSLLRRKQGSGISGMNKRRKDSNKARHGDNARSRPVETSTVSSTLSLLPHGRNRPSSQKPKARKSLFLPRGNVDPNRKKIRFNSSASYGSESVVSEEDPQDETQEPTVSQVSRAEESELSLQTLAVAVDDHATNVDIEATQEPTDSQITRAVELESQDSEAESSEYYTKSGLGHGADPDIQHEEESEDKEHSEVYGSVDMEEEESEGVEEDVDILSENEHSKKEKPKQTSMDLDEISEISENGQSSSEARDQQPTTPMTSIHASTNGTLKRKKSGKKTSTHQPPDANLQNGKKLEDKPVDENANGKRRRRVRISNRRRAKLHSNQVISVKRIKNALDYEYVRFHEGACIAISESMNYFATLVLQQAKALVIMKSRERVSRRDIISAICAVVPYSLVSTKIASKVKATLNSYLVHNVGKEEDLLEYMRLEKTCGLNISISSLRNLARQVNPTIEGVSSDTVFVALGAAVEVIGELIIHRSVGAMISASLRDHKNKDMDEDDALSSFKKSGIITMTRDDVNVAIHHMVNMDHIGMYSSSNVYFHRKLEYDEELAKETAINAKRNEHFQSKRHTLKKKVSVHVKDTNQRKLLEPSEVVSFLVQDNTIPMIFRKLNLAGTLAITSMRQDTFSEKMQKKFSHALSGDSKMQPDHCTLKTLEYMWHEVAESEHAKAWHASHRN